MNGNSQINYIGGWNNNNNPSTNYSQGLILHGSGPRAFADNWPIPHQTPTYFADNRHILHQTPTYYPDNPYIPHQAPAQYVDNRNLLHQAPTPHQAPAKYVDNRNFLHQAPAPHHAPTQYVENRNLPHQAPAQYVDYMNLPHQAPAPHQALTQYVDNSNIPHQAPAPHHALTQYVDHRNLPHQAPAQYVDSRNLPHQAPAQYVDSSNLPHQAPVQHQAPTQYVDNRNLPYQAPAQYVDSSNLPHQAPVQHQAPTQYVDNRNLPYQAPAQYVDNGNLPHQAPTHYVDNKNLPHQAPAQYVDNKNLPYQAPAQYVDNRNLPHQAPAPHQAPTHNRNLLHQTLVHYEDKMCLPHQKTKEFTNKCLPLKTPDHNADKTKLPRHTSEAYADKRQLPHQTSEDSVDKKLLPQQTPEDYADKKLLPQQTPEDYADKKHLQQQTPEDSADKKLLPQQTPEDSADKKLLPQQTPEDSADKKPLPQQTLEDSADKKPLPQQTPEDSADKKPLPQQTPKDSADKKPLPQQTPKHSADKKLLPQQTPKDSADKNLLPQQTPKHSADKKLLPQQTPKHSVDKKLLPQQTPKDSVDKNLLPQQTPKHSADKKLLPQQTPKDSADKNLLPQQTPKHSADKKLLPQQTPKDSLDKKLLPQQTPKHSAHKKLLPQQTPKDSADKNLLPQQTPKHSADKKLLPQQTPKDSAGKNLLPQQTPKHCADKKLLPQQTLEDCANKKCLPPLLYCEICDLIMNPKCMESHNNGKKHRRRLIELSSQIGKEAHVDGKKGKRLRKKLRRRLSKLHEKSMKDNISNEEIRHIQSSQVTPVVQPKKVPADVSKKKHGDRTGAKDCDFKVANVRSETSSFKEKKVPAEMSKRKVTDNTDANDHGFKHEIKGATGGKYMKMNDGTRFVKSSQIEVNAVSNSVKSLVQTPEITPPPGRVASSEIAPVLAERSSFEPQSQHVSASLSQESKGKKHHKFQNTTVEKNDQPQSTPVELNASTSSNIIAETEHVCSDFVQGTVASHVFTPAAVGSSGEPRNHGDLLREVTETKEHHEVQKCDVETVAEDKFSDSGAIVILPHGLMTYQALIPSPAVGSSFEPPIQINSQIEVEESTKLHEVQNHSVETKDQPHSMSMECHATAGSDINTLIEGTCSDSGAVVIAPPQSPIVYEVPTPVAVIQTEMSDSKVHNDIQNHIADSNKQQHSISMELHDIATSMTNNQTKIVNSDSTAMKIYTEPLASPLPDAAGSSFDPVESQHPAEESDIELLPPVLMEIDGALEASVETKTEDESSQVEMEMDVNLSPESGRNKLLKVSVCLTCGDEGFEEAIVYCSKCGDYAMHRYCLAGPVIFTDKVTWFCEDCEEMVVQADHPNSETPESEKEVVFDPEPIADPIWSGSLQVFNKSFDKIRGLMGHLSTLACPKVREEARHLPDVLYANLLQRSAVWPESFKKFGTNNLSIGLYFFPQNESVERYYDELVDEMISNNLAIRVVVEKAELLIFPSTLLPRQYKRFHSKYYLWGAFRRKQASNTMKDT